ncbi:aspartate aminotransferase family protein [Spirochaeta africana]|uniref:Ornithine/acetylornithine aminotransferase n=1 Tax=Spirochaeta africana (strain ATCC 700263 / DSM 8902 / Z-7692) TaxID=889378 RepID=H9UFK8_SPIAZ|nr:aminotransferase class III-fold pyridoxal phosphate-dependent enzyme [Spirochaeta africana]AFG36301.1 ornithine/acetylornithine aminotransferase [Spirochaeta africana DSM 8902]
MAHFNTTSFIHEPPFPRNYGSEFLLLDRGKGSYLYDTMGKRYLDFGSGIAVNSLGYGRKDLARIAARQMKRLIHVSNLYATEPAVSLAQRIIQDIQAVIPEKQYQAVHFGNSGTEAIEGALKYARRYSANRQGSDHTGFIAFSNSFHGRTMGALSVTSSEKYRAPFAPLIPGVRHLPYNEPEALRAALQEDGKVAGIILEVLQGEGGLNMASPSFISAIQQEAAERDIPIIVDEVQSGLGRTGRLLASPACGLKPDIICLSKPLAGGLPLSATVITDRINVEIQPGDHGSTFGGGPVTTAVALEVWSIINNQAFLSGVRTRAAALEGELRKLAADFDCCGTLRGEGMLLGVPVNLPQDERSNPIKEILDICREHGLLVLRSGENIIRIAPPLTISEKEIRQGVQILRQAITQLHNAKRSS